MTKTNVQLGGVNIDVLPTSSDGNSLSVVGLFDSSNMSAFGVLQTDKRTPIIQGDFVYGLNVQRLSPAVVSGTGAAVDTNEGRLRIQCGTGASNYAYIMTRQPIRYRAGQGIEWVDTPIFGAGAANNIQFFGVGGIASNAIYDGYGFAMNGTTLSIAHYNRGTATFTAQSAWNGDKADGSEDSTFTFDKTKGTPCLIKYPYLGYGNVSFYIQNPTNSRWQLVHTIQYSNTTATTQLSNPSLFGIGYTINSGNTTNQIMYLGSYAGLISGERTFVGNPKWAADSTKASVTTEVNLLSVKNATTYNGVANRGMMRLNSISVSSSAASGTSNFRFKFGATIGGSPSFTTVNGTTGDNGVTITSGNSIASFDVAGTTVTNGTYEFGISCDNPNSQVLNLIEYNIFVAAGETLTISAFSTNTATMSVTLNWTEDI